MTFLGTPCLAWSFPREIAGMVEAQIRELVTAVQSVQAQMTASEEARTTLQAQVDRMGRASGERKIGVDTRNLGRLLSVQWHRQPLVGLFSCLSQLRGPGASGTGGEDAARGAAADGVVNAGSAEGLCAWQLLVERYDPHIRSKVARRVIARGRPTKTSA